MISTDFIEDLSTRYFDASLSEEFKARLSQLPMDRPDVHAFVERAFSFMKQAGIPAQDTSVMLGDLMGSLLARILPGAWEGRVPPITIPGRHGALDEYIASQVTKDDFTMLDIGCGFPPFTTLDTAKRFPNAHITGVDPSLPHYLLHDENGNYATLDESKSTIYFQPSVPTIDNWNELLQDSAATKQRFEDLLNEMLDNPSSDPQGLPRLEIDPIAQFRSDKLNFIRGGIGQVDIPSMDVIRCFNVLFYFDNDFYHSAVDWFSKHTNEGAVVILGGNWAGSTESYYTIYHKKDGSLEKTGYAFSLDCINPVGIVTWYASINDDLQTLELVDYIRTIREDKAFMSEYYSFTDDQRTKYGICPRDEHGYYGTVNADIDPQQLWMNAIMMLHEQNSSGLNQKAADVLSKAGRKASINNVGHIVVSV